MGVSLEYMVVYIVRQFVVASLSVRRALAVLPGSDAVVLICFD